MFDGIAARDPKSAVSVACPDWQPKIARNGLCPLLKRLLDVSLSGIVLVLLAPAYALIALIIVLDSPGPALFRQKRTGLNGRVFEIYKFRTMHMAGSEGEVRHATRGDDRVTRVGRFLRETSLDEIPQLVNIVRGEMAIVGPRPHAIEHDQIYSALLPQYTERFAVLPGLTGLAQVRGFRGEIRELNCMSRRVHNDVLYAQNWSFVGDLSIIMRTVPLLLSRVNAH
jgi:putative colanic acid biosynthesis UDP-glucose lipid carrier transferase